MIVTPCVSCDAMPCEEFSLLWQQCLGDLCLAEETRVPLCLTDVGGIITSCGVPRLLRADNAALRHVLRRRSSSNGINNAEVTVHYLKIACNFRTAFTLWLDFQTSRLIYTDIYQHLYFITLSKLVSFDSDHFFIHKRPCWDDKQTSFRHLLWPLP